MGIDTVGEKGIGNQFPEDLHKFWGVARELHVDLVDEGGVYSSKGSCDPLRTGVGGGLLTPNVILLQNTSCYPVKSRYVA